MSIVTRRGDTGGTDLAGSVRTSKASLRVECYGTVDELISQLGFARSICPETAYRERVKEIQRVLFRICSSLATVPESDVNPPEIGEALVGSLDDQIRELESSGLPRADWAIAGEYPPSAAMDVARTICRRAERCVVRLTEAGEAVDPNVIVYLNRLSDLLWLFARRIEADRGVNGALRDERYPGKPWSPAW